MGLFSFRKNNQSDVVWRDSKGKIRCLGDRCPKECDDSCPIYINTRAAMYCQAGMGSAALTMFEQIIDIAPDFYDAWNNMGSIYGSQSEYQRAYDCYAKAHEISPKKPAPLVGLALTSRDLKQYEECLKWCDEYDKMFRDHRLDEVRKTAKNALASN